MEQAKLEDLIRDTMLNLQNELAAEMGLSKSLLSETLLRLERIEQSLSRSDDAFFIYDSAGLQDIAETLGL